MDSIVQVANTRIKNLWVNLKASLYFLPSIIVLLFIGTAVALIQIDISFNTFLSAENFHLFGTNADGARGVLTTIAASMITVAGVVFSITIVALSLTSSQYSSRVLRNFMSDHKNQMVLGVFVGIFAYCLIVLRSIGGEEEMRFIPNLSLFFSVILSLVGIGIFVFFIHHIANSIQASQILSNIFDETIEVIDMLFPDEVNDNEENINGADGKRWMNSEGFTPVYSDSTGYVQKVDTNVLLKIAKEYDLVLRMEIPIGSFLIESTPFISFKGDIQPEKKIIDLIRNVFTIEKQRTIEQDAAYGIRQMVDVALKALSPGINDTTTAVMCIERLTAILCRLAKRRMNNCLLKEGKTVRVIINEPEFGYYMDQAFDQIRHHGSTNITILQKLSWAIKTINDFISTSSRKEVIKKHNETLLETVEQNLIPGNEKTLLKKMCTIDM